MQVYPFRIGFKLSKNQEQLLDEKASSMTQRLLGEIVLEMLTGVNRIKTTGRAGYLIGNAIPPTPTGAVATSRGVGVWLMIVPFNKL